MVGSGSNQVESMESQHQGHFCNLDQRRDWEGSANSTHNNKSQSHEENAHEGATSLMRKMLRTCNWKLII